MTKKQFKAWRQRLGLSQVRAAAVLGYENPSIIVKMECGLRSVTRRIELLCWFIEKHGEPPATLSWG